jgi:hypothetical protein
MPMSRSRLLVWGAIGLALALVAVAVVVGVRWWREAQRSDLERAVAMAPSDSEQLSWTDWSGVREELDVDLGANPSGDDVTELLDRGFEADLTQTTALGASAVTMQAAYGFSPATVDWELFSQSEKGAVVMVQLPESANIGAIEDSLAELGYVEPESDTGVWEGGVDVVARIGGITPELNHVVVDEDRRLVLSSDEAAYLEKAASDVREENGPEGVDDVLAATDEPLAAAVYTGDHACAKLAMSQADPIDQEQADELLADAGEVNPVTGFAIGLGRDGDVVVAMSFESDEQARTNADTRQALASGPAPGEGGDYAELFEAEVTAEGKVVTMDLEPVEGRYVFSALKDGPVLFATC